MIRRDSDELKINAYSQPMLCKRYTDTPEHSSSRKDFLFQKLPSLDATQPSAYWQIKKSGSAKCIQVETTTNSNKPLSPQNYKKSKFKALALEENNNNFDLGSSRHFQRAFTIKAGSKVSGGGPKTTREDYSNAQVNSPAQSNFAAHRKGQKQQTLPQPHQTQCPFSSGKSIKDIVSQFMDKKPKTNQARHSEFEKIEGLDDYAKEFGKILSEDPLIGPIIGDAHEMKGVVRQLIDLSNGNKLVYHFETLKQLHQPLNITGEMFNQFKYLYIKKLISMSVSVEMVFKCAQAVENFRGAIICESRSIQDVKDNIRTIAKNMYAQIFEDFSLSPLFKGTKQEEQAIKFSRIFGFILGSSESTNYVMDSMRDFHIKFEITNVQYSIFKYYLSQSLSRHTQQEVVWYVLEQTDAYKAAVINQDSIKNLVYKQFGIDNFTNEFIKLCYADPYINKNFIHKVGSEQFAKHANFFLHHTFNKQNNCFTLEDLRKFHCPHSVNNQLYNSIKDKLMIAIQRLNPQRVIFSDFEEEFDLIQPYITNQKLPCDVVGRCKLQEMVPLIADELISNLDIRNVFDSNDANISKTLLRKFEYLLSGRKYFKRSDIQAIHSRLKISEYVFEEFVDTIEKVIQYYDPSLIWMIDVIKQWKYIIITE